MIDTNAHDTLGEDVMPSRYELRFDPDFKKFEFDGWARIHVNVKKKTASISLNASELKIKGAKIKTRSGVQYARPSINEKEEILTLTVPKAVYGEIEIEIEFKGYHNDKMYGFYRSSYNDGKKEGHILTTQFEPASARKAFPCFDEPSFKATFDLSLLVDEDLKCISNMPISEEQKVSEGKKRVSFMTTPKMSTYLLYVGVGDFTRTSSKYRDIVLSVITTPGKEKYAKLALGYASSFLSYYEKYFGIKFPLPKMDLIAIPDFAAGAMENWGAITFRESALLGDEKSSVATKQRIAEVIAHEYVHQWFGDLVTMKWWNDLWLNESFANFMSYKALDAVMPEWEMLTQYTAGVVGAAFAADQMNSTHPISVKVNTPAEISQIFDDISYNKGGAVLNMLEGYVGSEVFRKGLNVYLKKNAYSNAEKYDLWNSIGAAAKSSGRRLAVSEVAQSWIDNKGYPMLAVRKSNGDYRITQNRFRLLDRGADKTTWLVPVNISYPPVQKEASILMKGREAKIEGSGKGHIKLNVGQKGFYRTMYTQEMLDNLGELIKGGELSGLDGWGIENDLYAVTKKNMRTLNEYLDFVEKYCFAAKYPLNVGVLSHLRGLYGLFYDYDESIFEKVRVLLKGYSAEIIKQVGWKKTDDESSTTTLIRNAAIMGSGLSGEKTTVNKAKKLFGEHEKGSQLDPNIRSAIYGLVAWSGNRETYNMLSGRYASEELPEEKIRLLASLGMFRDPDIIRDSLNYSLSKHVRYQDAYYIPVYVSMNPAGKSLIWAWTRKNWQTFKERFPSGTHMLGRYIENVAGVNDPKVMAEVRTFFKNKENMREDIKNSLEETLEIMEVNSGFASYNKANMQKE